VKKIEKRKFSLKCAKNARKKFLGQNKFSGQELIYRSWIAPRKKRVAAALASMETSWLETP